MVNKDVITDKSKSNELFQTCWTTMLDNIFEESGGKL